MASKGAIITGAASGVGLELSKLLLAKGWDVIMTDINPAGAATAEKLGEHAFWVKSDISDWDSQVQLFEKGICYSLKLPQIDRVKINLLIKIQLSNGVLTLLFSLPTRVSLPTKPVRQPLSARKLKAPHRSLDSVYLM
jgi:D-arabinose 1-dehydrogenase-like Zn-dependent alcohol dehydrogenase